MPATCGRLVAASPLRDIRMSQRDDTSRRVAPTLPTSQAERGRQPSATSGRVAFDSRGNAVWEMRTADHRYVRDASTTLVRKLQSSQLSLETTAIVKKPEPAAQAQLQRQSELSAATNVRHMAPMADSGNPYNRGPSGALKAHARTVRQAPRKVVPKPVVKPSLFERLMDRLGAGPGK
jgi:hypothetical protein